MKLNRIFSILALCSCAAFASCEKPEVNNGPESEGPSGEDEVTEIIVSLGDKDDDRMDIETEIHIDEKYLDQFNIKNGTDYPLFPVGKVTLASDGKAEVTVEYEYRHTA